MIRGQPNITRMAVRCFSILLMLFTSYFLLGVWSRTHHRAYAAPAGGSEYGDTCDLATAEEDDEYGGGLLLGTESCGQLVPTAGTTISGTFCITEATLQGTSTRVKVKASFGPSDPAYPFVFGFATADISFYDFRGRFMYSRSVNITMGPSDADPNKGEGEETVLYSFPADTVRVRFHDFLARVNNNGTRIEFTRWNPATVNKERRVR